MAAAAIYQRKSSVVCHCSLTRPSELHGNPDGTIPATFQFIYVVRPPVTRRLADPIQIGWKPDPSQPKPLARGSAKTSLRDVLEDPSGDAPKG